MSGQSGLPTAERRHRPIAELDGPNKGFYTVRVAGHLGMQGLCAIGRTVVLRLFGFQVSDTALS